MSSPNALLGHRRYFLMFLFIKEIIAENRGQRKRSFLVFRGIVVWYWSQNGAKTRTVQSSPTDRSGTLALSRVVCFTSGLQPTCSKNDHACVTRVTMAEPHVSSLPRAWEISSWDQARERGKSTAVRVQGRASKVKFFNGYK